MQEYLIYKILATAVAASLIIWANMTRNKKPNPADATNSYADPIELEDGDYAIPKPEDHFMEGVEYDSISSNIKIKQDGYNFSSSDTDSVVGDSV